MVCFMKYISVFVLLSSFALGSVPSLAMGSVPSLEVAYRQSISTNEALSLTVSRLASTSAVPVEVGLCWKDARGRTMMTFEGKQALSTNVGDYVEFRGQTPGLKRGALLYPHLTVVPEGGARQVFAYGFCPVDVQDRLMSTAPVVRQSLPCPGLGCPILFSIAGPQESGEWEVRVSVLAPMKPKTIEVFEDSRMIYQSGEGDFSFLLRLTGRQSILRVRMTDESGHHWYGQALRPSRPQDALEML